MWADHVKDIDSERRLRIAYFSQDLNNHPVGRFLEPLLNSHDRNKFEIICISCSDNNDSKTEDLRGLSDKWLDVSNKDDLSAARLIAETQPDLLVELELYRWAASTHLNCKTSANPTKLFRLFCKYTFRIDRWMDWR